ncbi:hypothetical protein BJY52DRAFT_1305929 [Lactarius psammicola]|nr:hypothetical protein BJY52DRAFT_1305929 [Lactarius psammicola]
MPSTPTTKPHKGVKMPSHCHTAAVALHYNDRVVHGTSTTEDRHYLNGHLNYTAMSRPLVYWRAPAAHIHEKQKAMPPAGPCEPCVPTMKTVTQPWGCALTSAEAMVTVTTTIKTRRQRCDDDDSNGDGAAVAVTATRQRQRRQQGGMVQRWRRHGKVSYSISLHGSLYLATLL